MATPTYPRRLLVVDEDRIAADSLVLVLRRMGHYVRICYDGAGALEAARQLRPDAVFLDLAMSGIDSLEVARQLRGDARLRHVLIVGTTAAQDDALAERSREAGLDYCAVKPLEPDFIRGLLGRRRV